MFNHTHNVRPRSREFIEARVLRLLMDTSYHHAEACVHRVAASPAPCISQAPFHVPIRGGYQGGARLSKMDCSDTTQSLQVSLEGQFKKSFLGLSSSIQEVGKLFLVSPQNTNS